MHLVFLLALIWAGCAHTGGNPDVKTEREYFLRPSPPEKTVVLTEKVFESLGVRSMSSSYFDKGMAYTNSRFDAFPFSNLLKQYPAGKADAVLLDCFDDYQGILSLKDVEGYDLHLATEIHLDSRVKAPSWLKPLLVLVPDGKNAPFQERFMTANIRALRFVNLADYYRPLKEMVGNDSRAQTGFDVYRDNCLFCHSINEIGGNKGGSFKNRFNFSRSGETEKFVSAFSAFHSKDNADKQNMEQFVTRRKLISVSNFLNKVLPN